jgi:TPR repeat protein
MSINPEKDLADRLYAEGMKYNWRQNQSPANAALSRAAFERAANLGHTKALRELAEMVFLGSGGQMDQEQALWLKWSAFRQNDDDALEELVALLESYAESGLDGDEARRATKAAQKAEEAAEHLSYLGSYLFELVRERLGRTQAD